MRTKLVLRRLSSLSPMLRMMQTLLVTVSTMTRTMMTHWTGWLMKWTSPWDPPLSSSVGVPGAASAGFSPILSQRWSVAWIKKRCIECIAPENPPPPHPLFYRLVNFSFFFIFRKLICHNTLLHFFSTLWIYRITFSVFFILFFPLPYLII